MSSHALTIPNTSDTSSPIIFVNLSQCKILTPKNYPHWSFQIESFLLGFDLFKYLDGSYPPPSPTITAADTIIPNPAYSTWTRQDRLLLGSLIGTLDSTIAPLVIQSKTSRDAWSTLAQTFGNPSRGHILQIKNRLESIIKTPTQSVTEYMHAIKYCTIELANLGKPMDPEDITSKIIRGLDPELYRSVIDAVNARDTPISFGAFHEKLIHHELTTKPTSPSSSFPVTAHAVQHRTNPSRYTPRSNKTPLLPTPNTPPSKYNGHCQYCGYKGHSLSQCRNFKKDHPEVIIPSFTRPNYSRPQVHTTTASSSSPSSWLVASGATHHLTNDLSNLALHNPYPTMSLSVMVPRYLSPI